MAPREYHFVTDWRCNASLERVWSVVLDIQRYPGRWRNFRRVAVTRGDGKSVGSRIACEVHGSLPYSLRYVLEVLESRPHTHILLRSTGDLVGTGRWQFQPDDSTTQARYDWDVATTNPILNLIAPLARGLLADNHQEVMANGYATLRPHVEELGSAVDRDHPEPAQP